MLPKQANFGVMVIVFSLGLQLQMRPFLHDVLNNMEAASLMCAFFTLSSGVFMFSPNTPLPWRTVLTVGIFIANIGFLVYAGRCLYVEAKRQHDAAPPSDAPSLFQKVLIKIGIRKSDSKRVPREEASDDGNELPTLSKAGSVMGTHAGDGGNPMIAAYDSLNSGRVTQI